MHDWENLLACPTCRAPLQVGSGNVTCSRCAESYPRRGAAIDFLGGPIADMDNADARGMVATYRSPDRWLGLARRLISSEYFPGRAWREARRRTLEAGRTLVIGSGVSHYENAIHLDLDDFPGVDLIADAHQIPLRDASVEGVLCEVVLEHVAEPQQVISEAHRVLSPGGRAFFIVPFLFPFHGHPADYRRWSREGLLADFADFEDLEVGIHGGPCSAMVHLLSEWGYLLTGLRFPKGYVPIKGTLTALFFPLKFLDALVHRFPEAHRMAATLYVSGRKG